MLIGEYQHSVDEKGRVALPSKFRKSLTDGVVVTKGLEPCLHLYPVEEWTRFAEKLTKLPSNKIDVVRLMLSQATHCDIDSQGRILIPASLLQKVSIKGKATLVGLYTRGEIWNDEAWNEYRQRIEDNSENISKDLGELNLL